MFSLRSFFTTALLLSFSAGAFAQFAPQTPLPGNDAIRSNDNRIAGWADGCTLQRGWLDIADTSLGMPSLGDTSSALGEPDANVLSLGDGGAATLTFAATIRNDEGPDFAVFENGFADPLHPAMAYLELAFVEVSSDGIHFSRFPATCHIQDTLQSDNFTYSDASLVHNLAGKYTAGYGTPFDLEELKDIPGLDIDHISHVRLIDVVGSLDTVYGSRDKDGHIINDPYPSHYVSGGFDLDAVAVLNSNAPTGITGRTAAIRAIIYPNPFSGQVRIRTATAGLIHYHVSDIYGRQLLQGSFREETAIDLTALATGIYLLQLDNGRDKSVWKLNKQ